MRITVFATKGPVRIPDGAIAFAVECTDAQATDINFMRDESQSAFAAIARGVDFHGIPTS